MRRDLIANIIDTLLIFTVTAIFAVAVCGYFISGFVNIIVSALTIAVCTCALISIMKKRKGKISLPQVKNVLNQFIFNEPSFAYEFINKALSKKYKVEDKKDYLLINSTAVFVRLRLGKLSEQALIDIFARVRKVAKKILVLSIDGCDKNATFLTFTLPKPSITVLNGEAVYRMLRWLDCLPEIEFELKKQRLSLKELKNEAISPNKARGYFITALMLILSSFFMQYSIYYLAVASVCITLGAISALNLVEKINSKR